MHDVSFIQVYPTLRCNQRCGFCFNQTIPAMSSYRDMSADEAFLLADFLVKNGFREVDVLGGEPMLLPWMKDFIAHIAHKGLIINVSTNGSMPEKIRELADITSDRMNIGFSLHGLRETHNVLTGSDNYAQILRGIEIMLRAEKTPIVKSALTRENIDEIPDLAVFLKNLGVTRYYVLHEDTIGRRNASGFSFPEFWESYLRIKNGLAGILDIGFVAASAFYKSGGSRGIRCDAGVEKIALLPDGSAFPCNLFFGFDEFRLGNIFKDEFAEIAGSPVLENLRNFQLNQCRVISCLHHATCTGGCPAHSYFFHGSVAAPDPRCSLEYQT